MGIFSESILTDFLGVFITISLVILTYYKWTYQYWRRIGIPYVEPSIPFGNLENPFNKTVSNGDMVRQLYKEAKARKLKHIGVYFILSPQYLVKDLDLIKSIMGKDFQHFVDRGVYINEKDDPIGAHLFAIGGVKWRNLRTKLTPTFTSGKMKSMFQTLVNCGFMLEKVMSERVKENKPLDIKELLACFSTDIIGSCAFGLECNTFKESDSAFRKYSSKIFQQSRIKSFTSIFSTNFPTISRSLGLRQIPKDISDFFMKVIEETVQFREKNNFIRKDFLQILINIKNNKSNANAVQGEGNTLTMNEITAQSFVFFLAGFETSSTTMTFALYEMATNPDIQEKVRKEINTVLAKHNGQITYDSINEMEYMGQVINESLRKYPPVPFVTRVCTEDYRIPDENIVLKKGQKVIIPILGIHNDNDYYPNPTLFDPERFNEENKKNRHQYAHIPFGEGPRICIGMRFGIMQTKVGLTSLLKKYKFFVNKNTQTPLKMCPKSFFSSAKGGIWLDVKNI